MPESNATLLVIGVGPGIGRAVTALFASKKFQRVALIARGSESLKTEKKALEDAVGQHLKVKTYAVDVANHDALLEALHSVEADLGKPDCVFYNAARVLPSKLLSHDVKEIELDFKVMLITLISET